MQWQPSREAGRDHQQGGGKVSVNNSTREPVITPPPSLPTHWLSRDSEEDGSSERLELSPGTLDSILDLTCAAPEFEGVLGTVERLPDPPKLTHRAVEVRILAPHQPLPLPSHQPHPLPSHQPHPLQPQLQPNEVRHSSDCTDQSYMTIVYPHTV